MALTELQLIWFVLIGFLFSVYAILDGFDLGVGILYLFTKKEEEKAILRSSIGPIWDGNEVWLIAGGAGLLAAFPLAYATIFSGMYLAVMILLWALIFRALSLEFRNQLSSKLWRTGWDVAFVLGSFLPALLLGIAFGNILNGLILDGTQNYAGTFIDLLNPFSLLIGLLSLFLFVTHGATYIIARTNNELYFKVKNWFKISWIVYLIIYTVATIVIIIDHPQLVENYNKNILLWVIPLLGLLGIIFTGYLNLKGYDLYSFLSSGFSILILFLISGISLFPNLVNASNTELSITIEAAASSETTLFIMLIITLIGLPLILIYTSWSYKTFIVNKIPSKPQEY